MKCSDDKCTITVSDDEDVIHKCQNSKGEHLNNVDVSVIRTEGMAAVHVTIYAIIDDPVHGSPYEATGRELLHLRTPAFVEQVPPFTLHWQSWFSIEGDGWGMRTDVLHHLPAVFNCTRQGCR